MSKLPCFVETFKSLVVLKHLRAEGVAGACRVWTALRFKDRMVKVIMDVSALKDQKKGIVLQSTVYIYIHSVYILYIYTEYI